MKENEERVWCDNCDTTFVIIYQSETVETAPDICCFCGKSDLSTHHPEEHDTEKELEE